MHRTFWSRRVLAAVMTAFPLCLLAQAPPLPEPSAFLREVRRHVRFDAMGQYAYVQRETEVKLDGDGKQTGTTTRVYEIFPGTSGLGAYKRLIERDGVPVSAEELQRSDQKRRDDIEQQLRRFRTEDGTGREKRLQAAASERGEREAQIDDVFRVCEFRLVGRDMAAGRPAILVAFSPRAGAAASTRIGAIAQKLAGQAWIDEADHEVVRVEAKAIEDVTYGFGIFARVYKGTTVSWAREKVNGEAWVPTRLDVRASARVFLFRRLGLHLITDYFNYRRFPANLASSLQPAR